jgi:RNA polymerase sigma-70 factor (ECF subfamily)
MLQPSTAEDVQALLLRRIAARDLQAMSEFYDQTSNVFFSVAARILSDSSEAEETIQDAYVQIWEKAGFFDPLLGSAFHWGLSIVRHRAIDRLRSRQRRARLIEQLTSSGEAEPSGASAPDVESAGVEDLARVRSALDRLPVDQKQAIELAFFSGLSHQEISELLQSPLGTVKARIRRGLLRLRDCLDQFE